MRSVVVILVVAGLFAYGLLSEHARARRIHEREASALRYLEKPQPGESDGYRFAFVSGDGLPPAWVASPLEPGLAERWFVRLETGPVYQYDTVRYHAKDDAPDVDEIRRYLATTPDRRPDIPTGWESRAQAPATPGAAPSTGTGGA